jgi:hypothetical protein
MDDLNAMAEARGLPSELAVRVRLYWRNVRASREEEGEGGEAFDTKKNC